MAVIRSPLRAPLRTPLKPPGTAALGLGRTSRRDTWWLAPGVQAVVFTVCATYLFVSGILLTPLFQTPYQYDGYLSPLFSPLIAPSWLPSWISPGLLILWIPLGFRATCYYYRKAYYRAFFLDPVACAVGEPRHGYKGETRFPFILQNLHRFAMYAAVVFIFILSYDVIQAARWPVGGVLPDGSMAAGGAHQFGLGIGTLVMLINVVLLSCYTFGCHSIRHLIGGQIDCYSCVRGGKARFQAWRGVSALNRHHQLFAWCSLFSVALTDVYIRLCAMGVIHDVRLF